MKLLRPKYMVWMIAVIFCFLISITKTNAQWSEVGGRNSSIINGNIFSITTNNKGFVYAGGGFLNDHLKDYVAIWKDSVWEELGGSNTCTFNNGIKSLTTDSEGNLYVAGNFTNSYGKFYVAKWDGSSWYELGGSNTSMFNQSINCICTDTIGNLYAAGNFTNSYGKFYVAKWDGHNWGELGGENMSTFNSGNDGGILAIATNADGNVYIGGDIINSNGNYYIARWNGNSWGKLGGANASSFNNIITTITTDTYDNIYCWRVY